MNEGRTKFLRDNAELAPATSETQWNRDSQQNKKRHHSYVDTENKVESTWWWYKRDSSLLHSQDHRSLKRNLKMAVFSAMVQSDQHVQ